MKLFDEDSLQSRRVVGRNLTLAAAGAAMFTSGWGMWTFFADLGKLPWPMVTAMFLLFDLAAISCAWNARINRVSYGAMGIHGWLVWVFAALSGLMSASDAGGREAAVRFLAPVVAAILFELLIRGERRDLTQTDSALDRVRRRVMARFGLLDDVDQDDETAATSRMAAKLANQAYRVNTSTGRRAAGATRRYHRLLRRASVRMDFANNPELIEQVRVNLDFLYRAVTATAPEAVADLNIWQSAAPESAATRNVLEAAPAGVATVATRNMLEAPRPVRIAPVRRPRRLGRLAGRIRPAKPSQRPTEPAAVPVEVAVRSAAEALFEAAFPAEATPPSEPAPASKTRTVKKKPGRGSRSDQHPSHDQAFNYWEQNRDVSVRELASQFKVSPATAHRWKKDWVERVPA